MSGKLDHVIHHCVSMYVQAPQANRIFYCSTCHTGHLLKYSNRAVMVPGLLLSSEIKIAIFS